jgi:indolepyruvate ferredoxin oxidoreductase, alpha subunit
MRNEVTRGSFQLKAGAASGAAAFYFWREQLTDRHLMLGNEAIARGLIENGCEIATSYPGTPASEILSALAGLGQERKDPMHIQWAVNEKVAFEIAYAGCMSGLRTAVSMKQVGLNVASDPLMSAAYMGTAGGFIVISADDPGPHSSQTEQDSRMMAMMAKIPVLDPESPEQAKAMIATAYALSEAFKIPVMLRPTTRVCHARQDILSEPVRSAERTVCFERNPSRWAATPKFRYQLHIELEEKLSAIAEYHETAPVRVNPGPAGSKAVVVSGVAAAHVKEILRDLDLWDRLPVYQVLMPFPLHRDFVTHLIDTYEEILVVEETTGVIEMQIADRHRVKGKLTNIVPKVGELLPETIQDVISDFSGIQKCRIDRPLSAGKPPTLCAGCPHRASFFAVKKAAPKGIYTSDIGCYTLGLNLGGVDTVLCMGAAVSQAAGFFHAYKHEAERPDIIATIGDSTFFHAGVPALIDAVVQKVGFVLMILDNRTTAMTGNQPTPATGIGISGESTAAVDMEALVAGCGVRFCRVFDPYNLKGLVSLLKEAVAFSKESGPAVVIARHPCVLYSPDKDGAGPKKRIEVTEACDGCVFCVKHFECPALVYHEVDERVAIDPVLCVGCGVCVSVCPKKAIIEISEASDHS